MTTLNKAASAPGWCSTGRCIRLSWLPYILMIEEY